MKSSDIKATVGACVLTYCTGFASSMGDSHTLTRVILHCSCADLMHDILALQKGQQGHFT